MRRGGRGLSSSSATEHPTPPRALCGPLLGRGSGASVAPLPGVAGRLRPSSRLSETRLCKILQPNFGERRRKGEVHAGMKESLHRTGPIGPADAEEGCSYRQVLCARALGVRVRGLRVLGRGEAATSENASSIAVCDDIDPCKPWIDERLRSCCDKRSVLLKYAASANSVPPMKPLSFPYRTCAAKKAHRS
jgi:hypothetical protein